MSTLLLRLAAPLQSWGTDSKFETRRTGKEPSKSGVIGLLAAALGRRRDESVEDLNRLRFGVRVDQEGTLLRDYHTVKAEKTAYITERYYIQDAVFLAGLESEDDTLLRELEQALHAPAFPLFLGRRSCPPDYPLCLGIREADLLTALHSEPWQASEWRQSRLPTRLRIVADALPGSSERSVLRDVPISFDPIRGRRFGWRGVCLSGAEMTPPGQPEHDAMAELKGGA